jgi:hypothetical protein
MRLAEETPVGGLVRHAAQSQMLGFSSVLAVEIVLLLLLLLLLLWILWHTCCMSELVRRWRTPLVWSRLVLLSLLRCLSLGGEGEHCQCWDLGCFAMMISVKALAFMMSRPSRTHLERDQETPYLMLSALPGTSSCLP